MAFFVAPSPNNTGLLIFKHIWNINFEIKLQFYFVLFSFFSFFIFFKPKKKPINFSSTVFKASKCLPKMLTQNADIEKNAFVLPKNAFLEKNV